MLDILAIVDSEPGGLLSIFSTMLRNVLKNAPNVHFFSMFWIIVFSIFVLFMEVGSKNTETGTVEANFISNENLIYLKLKDGIVIIETFPNIAPKHVERIKDLTRKGFYDNSKFFRVIDGFVAQVGDPTGTGMGGSGSTIQAEFSKVSHKRGIMSMARANDVNSADSQFFIVLKDSEFLDEKYTVWGRVVSGMEFVDKIKKSKTGSSGTVEDPDIIVSMVLASDVKNTIQGDL